MSFLKDRPWHKDYIDADQQEEQDMPTGDFFPEMVSYERAKDMLAELCEVLEKSPPQYSVVSQTEPEGTIATVTIEGVDTVQAYEFKNAQRVAAKSMYENLTDEEVSLKQAKPALEKLCRRLRYPEPEYASYPGYFEVEAVVDKQRCVASSYKSLERAEKEAAKEMYALLQSELDDDGYDDDELEPSTDI